MKKVALHESSPLKQGGSRLDNRRTWASVLERKSASVAVRDRQILDVDPSSREAATSDLPPGFASLPWGPGDCRHRQGSVQHTRNHHEADG